MTVTTSANTVVYRGNGSATTFAVPFKVLDEEHLVVRKRDYDSGEIVSTYIGTDYSYSGIGDSSGTLTLAGAALSSDYELVIERIVPYTQDLDIVNAGGFYPETVEEQLDLITMGMQQLADGVSRSLKVAIGDEGVELPNATNKYLILNEDGELDTTATALSIVDFVQDGVDAVTRSAEEKLKEIGLSPEDFGAVGDGVTDDTDAFIKLTQAYMTLEGVNKIVLRPVRYLAGQQVFAGVTGLGYAYNTVGPFDFTGYTGSIIIEGNGACLVAPSGFKYGSFDPVTGLATGAKVSEPDYRAFGVIFFTSDAAESVEIHNIEFDGNILGYTKGGDYNDQGIQIAAYGYSIYNCDRILLDNVRSHHHPLDGGVAGYVGMDETTPRKPWSFRDVICEHNGRQAMSLVGCNYARFYNCQFNFSQGDTGTIATGPGAGFDLEAESAFIRNVRFYGCDFRENGGLGLVADSGDAADIKCTDCVFVAGASYVLWPQMPNMKFFGCDFYGSVVNPYESAVPGEATQFVDCNFSGDRSIKSDNGNYFGTALCEFSAAEGVVFDNCNFDTASTVTLPNTLLPYVAGGATFRNCKVKQDTGALNVTGTYEGSNYITTTGSVSVGGFQHGRLYINDVLQARHAAVADATDAATAITQLNELLDRLRDDGVIAT